MVIHCFVNIPQQLFGDLGNLLQVLVGFSENVLLTKLSGLPYCLDNMGVNTISLQTSQKKCRIIFRKSRHENIQMIK